MHFCLPSLLAAVGSLMAAPYSSDLTPFQQPSPLQLTPTPLGVRAFRIQLRASLPPHLSHLIAATPFHTADTSPDSSPTDAAHQQFYEDIFDYIASALNGYDDLLLRVHHHCGLNGPLALNWLQEEVDPSQRGSV